MVGYNTDSIPGDHEWFVDIARAMVDAMAAERGEDIGVGVVTSTFTTPNWVCWIVKMWAYTSDCYLEMTGLETIEALEGGCCFCRSTRPTPCSTSTARISAASPLRPAWRPPPHLVTLAGLCGEVAVVGFATPNSMKPFVNDDCI